MVLNSYIIIIIWHSFECLVWCEWMCVNEIPVASLEGCVFYWYLSCKCNFSLLVLREHMRLCRWNIACFSSSIMGRVSPEGRWVNTLNSLRAFEDKWRKTSLLSPLSATKTKSQALFHVTASRALASFTHYTRVGELMQNTTDTRTWWDWSISRLDFICIYSFILPRLYCLFAVCHSVFLM